MKELFELLHEYHDQEIDLRALDTGLSHLLFEKERELRNNSIFWSLRLACENCLDGFCSEEYVQGFVKGVLSVFQCCPIEVRVGDWHIAATTASQATTEKYAIGD